MQMAKDQIPLQLRHNIYAIPYTDNSPAINASDSVI